MKKVIIKSLIIVSGIIIIGIKYKTEYFIYLLDDLFFPVLVITFLNFIASIIYYNTKRSFHSTTVKTDDNISQINIVKKETINIIRIPYLNSRIANFYIVSFITSMSIGNLLAYKYKKLNLDWYRIKKIKTEWQYDAYVESIYSDYSFFHLKTVFSDGTERVIFYYNWQVFFITLFIIMGLVLFIRNTIFYNRIIKFIRKLR